jgi:hypothetical protein
MTYFPELFLDINVSKRVHLNRPITLRTFRNKLLQIKFLKFRGQIEILPDFHGMFIGMLSGNA